MEHCSFVVKWNEILAYFMKHLLTQIWCTRKARMKQKSYDFYEAKRTLISPCDEATLHRRSLLHFSCTVRCASLKKSTAKRWIFLAEGVGFEPTCLSANGFQDRLVMTASISLRIYDAQCASYIRRRNIPKRCILYIFDFSNYFVILSHSRSLVKAF